MAKQINSASPENISTLDLSEMERMARADGETPVCETSQPETYTIPGQSFGALRPGSALPRKERGYRKLATLMSEVGDVVIFRRFQKLNMLNLLRLQAEFAALELSYETACNRDDASDNPDEQGFTQSFYGLRELGNNCPGSQLDLLDKINSTLDKYSTLTFSWPGSAVLNCLFRHRIVASVSGTETRET